MHQIEMQLGLPGQRNLCSGRCLGCPLTNLSGQIVPMPDSIKGLTKSQSAIVNKLLSLFFPPSDDISLSFSGCISRVAPDFQFPNMGERSVHELLLHVDSLDLSPIELTKKIQLFLDAYPAVDVMSLSICRGSRNMKEHIRGMLLYLPVLIEYVNNSSLRGFSLNIGGNDFNEESGSKYMSSIDPVLTALQEGNTSVLPDSDESTRALESLCGIETTIVDHGYDESSRVHTKVLRWTLGSGQQMLIDRSIVVPDFRLMTPKHVADILSMPADDYGFHIGPGPDEDVMFRHNPSLARTKGVAIGHEEAMSILEAIEKHPGTGFHNYIAFPVLRENGLLPPGLEELMAS